jgi:hypothetical protein
VSCGNCGRRWPSDRALQLSVGLLTRTSEAVRLCTQPIAAFAVGLIAVGGTMVTSIVLQPFPPLLIFRLQKRAPE